MQATALEYRYRFLLHALLFGLAFSPVFTAGWVRGLGIATRSTWLVLATIVSRQEWLGFTAASYAMLAVMLTLLALGAWLRVWGSAYVGASVVQSGAMHGGTSTRGMLADGPYRHTRNPLYLGTLLHTIGLALLVPPAGTVFLIATIWILQIRLALAEEPFLAERFGQPYLEYAARVPRFLLMPAAQVAAAGATPHWRLAVAGEIYFIGALVTLAVWGWGFNPTPIRQGLLVSMGLWLIAIALIPREKEAAAAVA